MMVIAVCEYLMICIMLYKSHRRSASPSYLLSAYLALDICMKARSLWLSTSESKYQMMPILLRSSLIILHEQPKWSLIPEANREQLEKHETFGLWTKSLFVWVFPLLLQARAREVTVNDLIGLPKEALPYALNQRFQSSWTKGIIPTLFRVKTNN